MHHSIEVLISSRSEVCRACSEIAYPQFLFSVKGFSILRCPSCGLGWTVTPPEFDPTSIYTKGYFQGEQSDGYADYQGSRDELAKEFRRVIPDIAASGKTNGKLLEVGCAYGFFLDEARQSFEVSGIELARDAALACQARGLNVVQYGDETFYARRGPFDVVVMLDVIEHLMNPGSLLHDLYRHTRPNALLMITTGDFGSFLSRIMRKHWRLMTPPQHLWYFTTNAISQLLAQYGFQVIQITHPAKRVPFRLITYQIARYLGLQHLVRGRLRGSILVNLHDAMRVIARRN
jgi:2-polyprenyl-3-methyl-5-hydroxy-6-metoxy-1,4-benzoquinol methylase